MKRPLWLLLVALLLAACGGGGSPSGGGGACPDPAVFNGAACTFDDAGTRFGP